MYDPPQRNRRNNWILYLFGGCLLVTLCTLCVAGLAVAGLSLADRELEAASLTLESDREIIVESVASPTSLGATSTPLPPTPTSTPFLAEILGNDADTATPSGKIVEAEATETPSVAGATAAPGFDIPADIERVAIPVDAQAWAETLFYTSYPINDAYNVAIRLDSVNPGERLRPAGPYSVGDTQSFVTDSGRTTAELIVITEHAYFWFEEGADFDRQRVIAVANEFETDYYPFIAEIFGEAWTPGIDNDPRFSVLHLSTFAGGELGFFDSSDEFPRTVHATSNEQEIIYLNLENLTPGSDLYFGTLVHEFQHLAQWNLDPNETVWLDEGLAQLAEIYVGLNTASTLDYLDKPETQLTGWEYGDGNVFAHYAAAYLFTTYFWEQLGNNAVQELVRTSGNGLQAVDTVLQGFLPGTSIQTFLSEWAVANLLDDPSIDVRYGYQNLNLRSMSSEADLSAGQSLTRSLPQFGTHYLDIETSGTTTIRFAGDTIAPVIPAQPIAGSTMWFAPGVDNTNSQMTARIDLTGINDAELTFMAWYELEEDYDFAYLSISVDDGNSWQLLPLNHQSSGVYGPSFNGQSAANLDSVNGGWVEERISLAQFGNRPVIIRFEIQTDAGIPSGGLAIDALRIDAINYDGSNELADTLWETDGFVAVGSHLPQYWSVQLVDNATSTVVPIELDAFNQGMWQGELGSQGGTLIVMPQTPFASDTGTYWVSVENN